MDEYLELVFVHDVNMSTTISLHYHINIIQLYYNSSIITTAEKLVIRASGFSMFLIRACGISIILNGSVVFLILIVFIVWLLFSGLLATIILRFTHKEEMIPFMALLHFHL